MNKKKVKSNLLQAGIGALSVVLAALIVFMMVLVSGIQGTARVVNYAGLVRGKTQRIIKLEIAQQPQDAMIHDIDAFIYGLRNGDETLNLVRLDDVDFQRKMLELDDNFQTLKQEIQLVRTKGYQETDIIHKSEHFFEICDEATGLAEVYSQKRASSLKSLEKYIIVDIVFLMVLIGYELVKALRYAAMNRALQSKVYLDEATGLPNKNKCEELLNDPAIQPDLVCVCSFDLNNLRRINNSMGHEMGDEYIRRFARLLRQSIPEEHFVGRDGGDEFLAILRGLDHAAIQRCLQQVRRTMDEYSQQHPEFPISYAVGYALSQDLEAATMRTLYAQADKNMYINKNHVKREEAEAEKRLDYRLLQTLNSYGTNFSDCLYCDAKQDTYRTIRASESFLLASDGNYSGAVEQIAAELVGRSDRSRIWNALQLDQLAATLRPEHPSVALQYQDAGDDLAMYGRLTLIFVDADSEGTLHHFILAFETIRQDSQNATDAKVQLTQYYEQLKQSILENDSYVDALLETADAIYSVNLTSNTLEHRFFKHDQKEPQNAFSSELSLPCAYSTYCQAHEAHVTRETLEGYRLTDAAEKLVSRFTAGEKQLSVEYSEHTPDGSIRWIQKTVLMTESLFYDTASQQEIKTIHGMILLKDTTKFHALEQQEHARLQATIEEVTSANRAKTEFLSRMSHDIRTPINGVMGMLEIIKKNREDKEKVDDCLEKIHLSSEHLLSLINDVLDMSKLENGTVELQNIPFDLEEFLQKVHALEEAQVAETGLTFHTHMEGLTHTNLVGSPLHLRQILLNLFSNAVKYNKPFGSIETTVRELAAEQATVMYEFKITDTGIGMSEAFVQNKLFEPFTQERSGARTKYQGTGLGMSIVKELVTKMGGTIQVESILEKGSSFTVRLPFTIDTEPAVSEEQQAEPAVVSLQGLHVLLVEDNAINMEIAEFFLDELGMNVTKAWNGQEAVDLFAKSAPETFDLILMDVMMPIMNGLEASRRIRAMQRPDAQTVRIFAMTANAFSDDIAESKAAGMNEHLSKPLNLDMLCATLQRAFRA